MIPALGPDAPATPTVSLQLRKILIVDEALPVRRKLLETLHRAGIPIAQIHQATGADAALETFVREHPTLVMAELVGDDPQQGLDMVLEMLQIDPQARIVLMTAEDARSPMVRAAVKAGVFAVVEKPLRHEKIRAVMAEIESEEGGIERFR